MSRLRMMVLCTTSRPAALVLVLLMPLVTTGCGTRSDGTDYHASPDAQRLTVQAWSAIERHNYARALELADHAARVDPDAPDVLALRGALYVRLDRLEEARIALERLVKLYPRYEEAHMRLGNIALRQSRFSEAARHYQKQLKIKPTAAGWYNLALAQIELTETAEARRSLDRALHLDPAHAPAYAALADLAEKDGAFDVAIEHAQKAAEVKPDDSALQATVGLMLLRADRNAEALTVLERVVEEAPWDYQARYNLGRALQRVGRKEEADLQLQRAEDDRENQVAVRRMERAVRLDPGNGRLHFALGIEYQKWGRLDDALRSYEVAKELMPNRWQVEMNIATVYLHRNELDEAVRRLRTVVASDSTSAAAWLNLGFVEARRGNQIEARQAWERAVALDGQYESAIAAFEARHAQSD